MLFASEEGDRTFSHHCMLWFEDSSPFMTASNKSGKQNQHRRENAEKGADHALQAGSQPVSTRAALERDRLIIAGIQPSLFHSSASGLYLKEVGSLRHTVLANLEPGCAPQAATSLVRGSVRSQFPNLPARAYPDARLWFPCACSRKAWGDASDPKHIISQTSRSSPHSVDMAVLLALRDGRLKSESFAT
jgi:hypothetical protein